MGNFAIDIQPEVLEEWTKKSPHVAAVRALYDWRADPEWPMYAFPPESRKSMIVRCNIVDKKIKRVSFLPVLINPQAQPRVVPREDNNFDELFEYMKDLNESQGLEDKYAIEGNEIAIRLAE